MKVSQIIGEPFRFRVDSARVGVRPYLVDLEEHDAFGKCDCPHFACRIGPAITTGSDLERLHPCKHIAAARKWLLDKIIREASRIAKEREK